MGPNASAWEGGGVKYIHTLLFHLESLNAMASSMCWSKCWYSLYSWCTSTQQWNLTIPLTVPLLTPHTHICLYRRYALGTELTHTHSVTLTNRETQASLKHASCLARTVRYLHRGLSHSDCGLVPQSSKKVVGERVREQQRRGGERWGGEGGRREELSGNDAFVGKWLELLAVRPILLYMV